MGPGLRGADQEDRMPLSQSARWRVIRDAPPDLAKTMASAAAAIGSNTTEWQMVRLMVWCGSVLSGEGDHTKVQDPERILLTKRAWCDQQCLVFIWLAWKFFGYRGRQIAMVHSDGVSGHTVCEVEYGGGWHLFDVSTEHQAVYRRRSSGAILSRDELVADNSPVVAEGHWWRGKDGVGKEGFYLPTSIATVTERFTDTGGFQ